MATQDINNVLFLFIASDHFCDGRGNDARGTESALQGVLLSKSAIDSRKGSMLSEALYGGNLLPLHSYGEQETTTHGFSIQQYRAGTADAMFAADVRTGQPTFLPQKVAQEHARFDSSMIGTSIHTECHRGERISLYASHE
jgi:hypothetical protein